MKTIFKLSALTSVLVGAVALVSLIPNDAQAGHNSYHFGNAYRNGYNGSSVYGRGPYGYGSTIYANPYAGNNYNNYNNYNNVYGYPSYGVGPGAVALGLVIIRHFEEFSRMTSR